MIFLTIWLSFVKPIREKWCHLSSHILFQIPVLGMSNMDDVNFQGGNRVSAFLSLVRAVLKIYLLGEVINFNIKKKIKW